MINRGHISGCGSVSCGRAGSGEKCLSVDQGKKLTFRSLRRGAHLPLLLLLAVSIAMAGCALTGTKASSSESQTPTVSISIMQSLPNSLSVSSTTSVSATVSNDVANAGVDWVVICTSGGTTGACGTFSPAHTPTTHTASGAATTFTAPIGVPAGNTVTVTALSATDHSKASASTAFITSTVTSVTITQFPPASFPSGGSLNVAVAVAGDASNAGVDWKAACGTIDCTSGFNGVTRTPPGVAATFTVPLESVTYPMIVGSTVTLTAFAAADHNFTASATFTVTGPISISITQAPPSTVLTNASVPVIAVVTNDPTNSGVTWTIASCDLSPCGSWSASSTVTSTQVASGVSATFFAPPKAVNHVMIQAAATASPTSASATVEISIAAPISIAITQGLVNKMIVANHNAKIVATVSNDAANEGVDWTVTCASAGACGSFSATHTVSGATTTFTAPAAVPANNTVTITATSTTDPTKVVSETETVTAGVPPNSLLIGPWVMLLTGKDTNGGPYSLGGTIVGDGNGKLTDGGLDLVDLGGGPGNYNTGLVAVVPSTSSFSIGPDGRGQIQLTLNTGNSGSLNGSFGVNVTATTGTIVLSVVFVTPNHALLSETDAFGSGTGTLDQQNPTDLIAFKNGTLGLNGTYSISLSGSEMASPNPKYLVAGAMTFSSSGTTYNETAYIADQSDKGAITSIPLHAASQTFNASIGIHGQIALNPVDLGLRSSTKFILDAWPIDARHFVITDLNDAVFGTPTILVSGYMVAQPPPTAFSGTHAFTEAGESALPASVPQAVGGFFTCDPSASTGPTGTLDVTPLGGTPLSINTIHALCSTGARGRSLITISNAGTTGISKFVAYPTVDQGFFLMELDGGAAGTSGPSGGGVARSQTLSNPIPPTAFSGKYASNFLATTSVGLEAFAGQIDSDGVSTLSGTVDVNSFTSAPPLGTPSSNATLSGSFTAFPDGRFPLVLMIAPAAGQPTPYVSTISPACYIVDANTCLLLGLDATAPGTGILELQNTGL